jgi:uncharacterized protein
MPNDLQARRLHGALLLATLTTLALPLVAGAQQPAGPPPPQISTSAVGEASVVPDRATIQFTVESRAATAVAAGADNARRQRSVIDALRAKGVAAGQITTAGYSVSADERFDSGQRRVVGYIARNTVQVEVPGLERLGALIDAALAADANLVSSLRFYSSRYDEGRHSALQQAVTRARADAEAMATAAGGSLGALLELSSTEMGSPRPMYEMSLQSAKMAAPETPISAGEQKVSVSVSARWQFLPRS